MKEASKEISFLGKDFILEGKITFQGDVRIEGKFEGEVFVRKALIVGETAALKGKIRVHTILIHGLVEGEVDAKERVEIYPTGKFYGTLFTPILTISEGGILDGNCKMEVGPDKVDNIGESNIRILENRNPSPMIE
jgi:cytoskeletal protein CcmA (bactofilin family)